MLTYVPKKPIDYKRIEEILNSSVKLNHFTNFGPACMMLERRLESLLEIDNDKSVICFSNGTAALHSVMLLCYDKNKTTRWVTPSFTFPSSVIGHKFEIDVLDIDEKTYTLPISNQLYKYDGIIITNLFGSYVDLEVWAEFCYKNKKTLIFDNASSPLSYFNGINICNFGDYSIGSLHHTKTIGFGEGGFVVTPKEDYDRLRAISNFGFNDDKKHSINSSNFKMSDISAAFILQHIEGYDIEQHEKIQEKIINRIDIEPMNYKPGTIYGCLPIVFNRKIDHTYFKTLNVDAQKYYKPLRPHKNSLSLYDNIVNFPLYSYMNEKDIETIVDAINIGINI